MSPFRPVALFVAFSSLCTSVAADGIDSGLVQVIDPVRGERSIGSIVRENDKAIEIKDINGEKKTVLKSREIPTPPGRPTRTREAVIQRLTEESAIKELGLTSYFAWQIERHFPLVAAAGKVAKIEEGLIYVAMGADKGVTTGQELAVFRATGELKDPDTGEVLGDARREIARVTVVDVTESYCTVSLVGKSSMGVKIGDEVRANLQRNTIAVLPLVDVNGFDSDMGKKFSEELTTALVQRKLPIVERTLVTTILQQIRTRESKEFDKDIAVKFGKLIGANYVVAGTTDRNVSALEKLISGRGMPGVMLGELKGGYQWSPEMYVRLIKVETGEILYAAQKTNSRYVMVFDDLKPVKKSP